MARNKLNDRSIRKLTISGRYSDGANLFLRVRDTGAKIFIVKAKFAGKEREWVIGPYGPRSVEVSLADARLRADEMMAKVKSGIDPGATDKEPVPEIVVTKSDPIPTFGAYATSWISEIEAGFRNLKHRQQWRSTLVTYCANFWDKKINEVDTDDVLSALSPIWTTKAETASRVRGRIEKVLSAAKARGYRSGENPAIWNDHLALLLPPRHKLQRGHHPAMAYEDLPSFWARHGSSDNTSMRAVFFTILTASRSGETRGATWSEFDLPGELWTVPASRMKKGREHRVPLPAAAVAIVEHMQSIAISDYVFPGGRSGKPLSDAALSNALKARVTGITVHGFRSSFRDWAGEETDYARELAEEALSHNVGDATERSYRRGDALEKRRKMMADWAAFVIGIKAAPAPIEQ